MLTRREFLGSPAVGGLLFLGPMDAWLRAEPGQSPPPPMSPFLQGNFAPVREEITADNLKVVGKMPDGLDGLFVRNGPDPQFPPIKHYHWFEGDGMLHGVRLQGGKASYRNRYVRTEGWKQERKAGKAIYASALDGPPDLKRVLQGKQLFKNTGNTALVWHDGKLLALWEGGDPHLIRVPELETAGTYNFGGQLKHAFTAHPKVDPVTGEMICFGYNFMMKPYVQYSVISAKGEITHTTTIDIPRPVMMHDFAITERHAVFMDLPETFNMARVFKGESPLKFEPHLGSRFGILPRHAEGSRIRWFDSPACYVFHTLNAYDDGDEVVLLACRMKEFPAFIDFHPMAPALPTEADRRSGQNESRLYRWRFNLKTGAVKEGPLDDVDTEFPRVNERFSGFKTRYGYCGKAGDEMFSGLIKYDLLEGKNQQHDHGKGRAGGEGVFVPRPDAKSEDDGWLLSIVHDRATGKSELVILDCREFTSPPVARVLIPARVPYGFHAAWVPGSAL